MARSCFAKRLCSLHSIKRPSLALRVNLPSVGNRVDIPLRVAFLCFAACLAPFCVTASLAAQTVPGEFTDIELDRELAGFDRFPTLAELRAKAALPARTPVLMLRLHRDGEKQHHVPVWSADGKRLAFQQSTGASNAATTSKLLMFPSLASRQPLLLTDQPKAYDYMFRWGAGKPDCFVFSRLAPGSGGAAVMFSAGMNTAGQGKVEAKTGADVLHEFPAVYAQTDGVMRLAYAQNDRIMQMAWNQQRKSAPVEIAAGTAPRWSRDGVRLLMLRPRKRSDRVTAFDVVLRNLQTRGETVVASPATGTLRSAVFAPPENRIAYFIRAPGNNNPWRIEFCETKGTAVRKAAEDVVVNKSFKSQGPAWSPSGEQLWFFSNAHQRQAYFPLRVFDCGSGTAVSVDYPQVCPAPADVALNPMSRIPEIAFTAKNGQGRDIYILLLNHY